jgi:hypothetical protein
MDGSYRQWLRLPLRGSVIDPRILAYNFTLRPAFTQRVSPGLPSAIGSRELGLDLGIRILATQPVSFNLVTNRSSGSTGGGFGTHGDFSTTNLSGVVTFRTPALPTRLQYSKRSFENTFSSSEQIEPISWANTTRTIRLSANNSKINLIVERTAFDDRLGDQDFSLANLSFTHRFRWGRGSSLETGIGRTHRQGDGSYLRRSWSERLRLQHAVGTNSDLRYQQHSSESGGGRLHSRSVSYAFSSRIDRWLTAGITAASRSARFDGGSQQVISGAPTVRVALELPLRTRLITGGRLGFEQRQSQRDGDGFVSVVNEQHAIDETRSFVLDQADVDVVSVVVRSGDEALQYMADLDYRLVELDGLLEVIIPATSRIRVNDVVLVSYRYRPPAELSGAVMTGAFNVSLNRSGFRLRHDRSLRRRPGGDDQVTDLGAFNENRTSLAVTVSTPIGRWDVDLRRTVRESDAFSFTSHEVTTTLALLSRPRLQTHLGMVGRFSTGESRRMTSRAAYATATWTLGRPARLHGRVQLWDVDVEEGGTDRSLSLDLNATVRFAAIEMFVQLQYNRRTMPTSITTSGASVRLVRRF